MRRLFCLLSLFATASFAFPADPPVLMSVAGSDPQATQTAGIINCAEGRFVPLNIVSGKPALVLGNESNLLTLYPLKPGEAVFGVRYDEPAGAKIKRYTFPAGANWLAVAGETSGTVNLVAVVNGATATDAPTVAGRITIALNGAQPPPVVPVLNPFQTKLQAAFRAEGSTADSKSKYAALWRNAAKTTVYDQGLPTPAALLDEMKTAVKSLGIPPGSMNQTARVVADELNLYMPKPATGTMDKAVRDNVSALFTRIAQDLEIIKGN